MTLPTSGTITFDQIRAELGVTGTITLNDPNVRALAGVPSGPIWLANLYGKSAFNVSLNIGGETTSGGYNSTRFNRYLSVTVNGGTGSYTYSWSITSDTGGVTPPTSTASAITITSQSGPAYAFQNSQGVYITVTVSSGGVSRTINGYTDLSYYDSNSV